MSRDELLAEIENRGRTGCGIYQNENEEWCWLIQFREKGQKEIVVSTKGFANKSDCKDEFDELLRKSTNKIFQ